MNNEIKILFLRNKRGVFSNTNDTALWLMKEGHKDTADKYLKTVRKAEKSMDKDSGFSEWDINKGDN